MSREDTNSNNIINLNLQNKGLTINSSIFSEIPLKYPNLIELDLSDNNLTNIPKELIGLQNLSILDIRSNPFENFEEIVNVLTLFPNLVDLKINLTNEEQVKLILEKLSGLEILNEKSTKEDVMNNNEENNNSIKKEDNNVMNNNEYNNNNEINEENENIPIFIDLNDDEIKNISLQNEISNFNEVYKKVSEKLKLIHLSQNFKEEFQNLIKEEINKINSNYETVPNYIYSTNVLESQLALYNYFNEKFLLYLEVKDKDAANLQKIINENITKSYLVLIKIIYKLYPEINEKFNFIKNNFEKLNNNINNNENTLNNNINLNKSNNNALINQYQETINMLQNRISQLENENKIMTEKMLKNASNIINNNKNLNEEIKNNLYYLNNYNNENSNISSNRNSNFNTTNNFNQNNNNNKNNLNIKNNTNISKIPFINNNNILINNSINNNNYQNQPICNRVFTIKMMKEVINDIYSSKEDFDKKSEENKMPKETLEQHMYTYLNQKYGLKAIIIEWANNIINGIKIFSSEDSEIFLFGKILRNEIEENARFIFNQLKESIIEYLNYFLKNKYPLKRTEEINNMINVRLNGFIVEDEWKKIINYLYEINDAKILENKIFEVIKKKYFKSKFDSDRKLTREEIISLSRVKEEYNIPCKELLKILHEFQIKSREKYLKNFVNYFKKFDTDNNGIISEEEFINLIYNLNFFQNNLKETVVNLLTLVDPYNNKQITFTECVNLFASQPFTDENGNINGTILDKICCNELNVNN